MAHSRYLPTLMAALLVASAACTKEPPPAPVSTIAPQERVTPSPVSANLTVLHKTFKLTKNETFAFEIPAHAVQPHLHGIFESFTGAASGASHGTSDDSSNIDFLIMNETQQADFANDRESETLFSVDSSHNQAVNFDLPASLGEPVKYYLVFRNSGTGSKVVEADFHVEF
jgi:hypothetical protein